MPPDVEEAAVEAARPGPASSVSSVVAAASSPLVGGSCAMHVAGHRADALAPALAVLDRSGLAWRAHGPGIHPATRPSGRRSPVVAGSVPVP